MRDDHATTFPNGCSLGATWSKDTLYKVGRAISVEARGLFNGHTNAGNRGAGANGIGITLCA